MFTSMIDRSTLIKEIAQIGTNYCKYKKEILKYPWDCENELYLLTKADVLSVFSRFLSGELTSDDFESWANFLEYRDDLGFEVEHENELSEIVFLLANPVINYSIDAELIHRLKDKVWAM